LIKKKTHLVSDGLNCINGESNKAYGWTYNQGVILGGLIDVFKHTLNIEYLNTGFRVASAAMDLMKDKNGVFGEICKKPCVMDSSQRIFKGIFARYLKYFTEEMKKFDRNQTFVQKVDNFFQYNINFVLNDKQNALAWKSCSGFGVGLVWQSETELYSVVEYTTTFSVIELLLTQKNK